MTTLTILFKKTKKKNKKGKKRKVSYLHERNWREGSLKHWRENTSINSLTREGADSIWETVSQYSRFKPQSVLILRFSSERRRRRKIVIRWLVYHMIA